MPAELNQVAYVASFVATAAIAFAAGSIILTEWIQLAKGRSMPRLVRLGRIVAFAFCGIAIPAMILGFLYL